MAKRSMFVGMDVHEESIRRLAREVGRDGYRYYGVIAGNLEAVADMGRALRTPQRRLRFVYEASLWVWHPSLSMGRFAVIRERVVGAGGIEPPTPRV